LNDQQAALRQLCFKFEVQEVVLTSGRQQWLGEMTSELELAVAQLHSTDRALRSALQQAAVAIGLSPEATVREVALAAPEPWGWVFDQHRSDVQQLIERVGQLSRSNRQLLARGHAATLAAISFLGGQEPYGYDARGQVVPLTGSVGLLDARA
jgi:FlgN protein